MNLFVPIKQKIYYLQILNKIMQYLLLEFAKNIEPRIDVIDRALENQKITI